MLKELQAQARSDRSIEGAWVWFLRVREQGWQNMGKGQSINV